jgi:hypothetical protein
MKKTIAAFVLLFVLSISAFADGEIGLGGKTCPQGQTCLVASPEPPSTGDATVIKKVIDYLKSFFG